MSAGLSTWGTIETQHTTTFFGPAHLFVDLVVRRADLMDKTLMFDLKLVSVNGGRAGK